MNWFERHLNWSLFFAIILIPLVIGTILSVIYLFFLGGMMATIIGSGVTEPTPEFIESLFSTMLPLALVSLVVGLGLLIWAILAILWYLGKKGRSKGYIMLFIGPWIFSFILAFFNTGTIGELIGGLVALAGLIVLFLLENQAIGYGAEFTSELAPDRWTDTGPYGGADDRQLKELDYTPDKKIMDMAGSGEVIDTGAAGIAGEAAPAEEKAEEKKLVEPAVSQQRLKMPILVDDTGGTISCFYHPGADAVNLCSRCKKYVCSQCNYITGTHPICRNCWEKRAEVPLAPPAQKKVSPPSAKPKKPEVVEPTVPAEPEIVEPAMPVEQKAVEPAVSVEQEVVEPVKPPEPEVAESIKPPEPEVMESVKPVESAAVEATKVPEPEHVEPIKQEPQKIVAPVKSAKEEAAKGEWLSEFMALYAQASPIITVVTRMNADGMPASPLDLMEGLKLRPMLERSKKLSKPKDKELREAKNEFEQVMSICIKIADAAADFVSSGGQALLGGPDFKRIVDGIETANVLLEKLSRRLANLS
jgi:hypothetical protein